MDRTQIKKLIENNDFLTLENLFFNGTEKEKWILLDEIEKILHNYYHIKNILK